MNAVRAPRIAARRAIVHRKRLLREADKADRLGEAESDARFARRGRGVTAAVCAALLCLNSTVPRASLYRCNNTRKAQRAIVWCAGLSSSKIGCPSRRPNKHCAGFRAPLKAPIGSNESWG